ncbi:HalOD1 output domain-containing protein [Halomicroarcula sp. GCM10025709]|uniref:HalOD1 output domain-containing protein n=1 Tax=Haloarcula pelagica TaxID=3033389 RepID=UPI0024C3EE6C|nr:HalOD1 output domain-containing protein [Halomicroarcula sp. YJ-61-S]
MPEHPPPLTETQVENRGVVETVVQAVAAVDGRPVTKLPPLGAAVDTDGLAAFVTSSTTDGRITFEYAGYRVCVDFDGTVTIHE